MFINKYADIRPTQYTESKQKKNNWTTEKSIFRVVIIVYIPTNAQIFNSCFIHEVRNASIDKTYEKSWLVV